MNASERLSKLYEKLDYCIKYTKQEDMKVVPRILGYELFMDNQYVTIFTNILDVADYINCSQSLIYKILSGERKTYEGHFYTIKKLMNPVQKKKKYRYIATSKDNMLEGSTMKEIADKIGVVPQAVSQYLKGATNHVGGYTVEKLLED